MRKMFLLLIPVFVFAIAWAVQTLIVFVYGSNAWWGFPLWMAGGAGILAPALILGLYGIVRLAGIDLS